MIAMHFTVPLPRDYDMAVVRRRAVRDATDLDGTAGLVAMIHGVQVVGEHEATSNVATVVAVWSNTSRMAEYLWSGEVLTRMSIEVGRPRVTLRPIASLHLNGAGLRTADILSIDEGAPLADESWSEAARALKLEANASIKAKSVHASIRAIDAATGAAWRADARTGRPRSHGGHLFQVAAVTVSDEL